MRILPLIITLLAAPPATASLIAENETARSACEYSWSLVDRYEGGFYVFLLILFTISLFKPMFITSEQETGMRTIITNLCIMLTMAFIVAFVDNIVSFAANGTWATTCGGQSS